MENEFIFPLSEEISLSGEVIGFIHNLQENFNIEHLSIEIKLTDETTVQVKF